MEIFIEKWSDVKTDPDGRRDLKTKSKNTINGEHAYACTGLSSWFRLGEYIIKYNTVMHLFGFDKYFDKYAEGDSEHLALFKYFIKYGDKNNIDMFVDIVNKHFEGDFLQTLLQLQEMMDDTGDECLFVSRCCHLDFDYKSFMKDRIKYLEMVRYKQEHREAR